MGRKKKEIPEDPAEVKAVEEEPVTEVEVEVAPPVNKYWLND